MMNKGKSGARRGIAASLHVKKHTKGTSNELSLSILDDRRSQVDDGASPAHVAANASHSFTFPRALSGKKRDASAAPKRSAVSGADVAGIALSISDRRNASSQARDRALANPEAEIRRRKKARRARRVVGLACALAACVAVVAFAAYSFASAYENQQQHKELLYQGFSEFSDADKIVLSADSLVTSSFEEFDARQATTVRGRFEDTRVRLSAAASCAESAKVGVEGDDAKAADQLAQSADARRRMLQLADSILSEEQTAKQACAAINECWESVIAADNLVREAANLVSDTTLENTQASQAKSEEALALLEDAEASLSKAQEIYPADYSPLSEYIEKRKEAIGYAIASDQAIYVQDKATAESNNERYNEADVQAAKLAAALPSDSVAPIAAALQESLAERQQQYMEARTQAAACDAFLRDYLGYH